MALLRPRLLHSSRVAIAPSLTDAFPAPASSLQSCAVVEPLATRGVSYESRFENRSTGVLAVDRRAAVAGSLWQRRRGWSLPDTNDVRKFESRIRRGNDGGRWKQSVKRRARFLSQLPRPNKTASPSNPLAFIPLCKSLAKVPRQAHSCRRVHGV